MGILEKFCLLSNLEYPVKGVDSELFEESVRLSVSESLLDSFLDTPVNLIIKDIDTYKSLNKPMPFGVFKVLDCVDTYLAIEVILVNVVLNKFREVNSISTGYSLVGYIGLFDTVMGDIFTSQLLDYVKRFLVFEIILNVLLDTEEIDMENETICNSQGRFVLVGRDKNYIMNNLEKILTYYFENSSDEVANLDDVVINICEVLKHVC